MSRINIAIASPGDVQKERDVVPKVFTRWNQTNKEAFVHPVMWESASVPTLGDHPQHILNHRIIDQSDLLLGILWSKLGTPTPTATSGTVEEIREFIDKKGPGRVMLYFCTRDLPYHTDPADLAKLRAFKEQMRTQGIYHEYGSLSDFERDLYFHLDNKILDFLNGELPLPIRQEADAAKKKSAKVLPADARLHQPIDFGNTLADISRGFTVRVKQWDSIDGVSNDKLYALGAHVYGSVAICLDRFLTFSAAHISEQDRDVIARISTRLKLLASQVPGPKEPFPEYWIKGRELCTELSAEGGHLEKWHR